MLYFGDGIGGVVHMMVFVSGCSAIGTDGARDSVGGACSEECYDFKLWRAMGLQ